MITLFQIHNYEQASALQKIAQGWQQFEKISGLNLAQEIQTLENKEGPLQAQTFETEFSTEAFDTLYNKMQDSLRVVCTELVKQNSGLTQQKNADLLTQLLQPDNAKLSIPQQQEFLKKQNPNLSSQAITQLIQGAQNVNLLVTQALEGLTDIQTSMKTIQGKVDMQKVSQADGQNGLTLEDLTITDQTRSIIKELANNVQNLAYPESKRNAIFNCFGTNGHLDIDKLKDPAQLESFKKGFTTGSDTPEAIQEFLLKYTEHGLGNIYTKEYAEKHEWPFNMSPQAGNPQVTAEDITAGEKLFAKRDEEELLNNPGFLEMARYTIQQKP